MTQKDTKQEFNTAVSLETKLTPPSMFNIIIHNDDYTPMDFVVEVLTRYFNCTEDKATEIMLTIHHQGQAIAGTFTSEIAESKVVIVNAYSKQHQYPLLCTMEKAD